MAAAPVDLVQRSSRHPEVVRTTIRSDVPTAQRAAGTEIQAAGQPLLAAQFNPYGSLAELPVAGGVPPGAFALLQPAGTLGTEPFLLRPVPELFRAEPELFAASVIATPVFIRFLRLLRRRKQESTMMAA